MTVEDYSVNDLPFSPEDVTHPSYWEAPPKYWHAHVQPNNTSYGNGIVGDTIVYMGYKPEKGEVGEIPFVNMAYGEIVVRDVRDVEHENTMEFIRNQSIENGEIIARFGYYTQLRRELSGGAPECPAWHEASKMASGFAWGYVKGETDTLS